MTRMRRFLILMVVTVLAAGCAPKAGDPLAGVVPGRSFTTLTSPVSLQMKAGGRSIGGRGFLVFRQPDRFHLALLAPFGGTIADLYGEGDRFTVIIPSRRTAYAGSYAELQEQGGLRAWSLMRSVLDRIPPADGSGQSRFVNSAGGAERVTYDVRGLPEMRENELGGKIWYRDYRNVGGVAFPGVVEMTDGWGSVASVVFEEPEIDGEISDAALTPDLGGFPVLPLSRFQGL